MASRPDRSPARADRRVGFALFFAVVCLLAITRAVGARPASRVADGTPGAAQDALSAPADAAGVTRSRGGGVSGRGAYGVDGHPAEIVALPVVDDGLAAPGVPIVFVSRNHVATLDGNRVGPGLDIEGRELTPGGRLMVWRPDGSVTDLTAGARIYDVREPDVSFDGRRIVFSGAERDKGQWHLYEIGVDGTGLRQLTGDERGFEIPADPLAPGRNESVFGRWGDYGPAYLPDGRIIFVSTRYATLSASCGLRGLNLYVLDPATGDIRRRTSLRSGAIDPSVLENGMVVYSNWVDLMSVPALDGPGIRPLEADYSFAPSFWGIWAISPDGTNNGRIAFAQGGLVDYGGLHQPRELPDGNLVVTARNSGGLLGDTLANAVTVIEPGLVPRHSLRFIGDPGRLDAPHAVSGAPLPDGRIAFSFTLTPTLRSDWRGEKLADYDFGLYVLDAAMARMRALYDDPGTDELDPVAAYSRSAAILRDVPGVDRISDDPRVDYGLTARLINLNVYADLPLELLDTPSPKAGTIARIDVYDDTQVFSTEPGYPHLSKQMPRLLASFPVDDRGVLTATVPTDRALMYILVNHSGVAARTSLAPTSETAPPGSVIHFFGHDYLRPNGDFVCTGCHRGHMIAPGPAMSASTNLARLATATASSTRSEFANGAWRATDVLLGDSNANWAWATTEGPGAWLLLEWPAPIVADKVLVYPLRSGSARVTSATLALDDGTTMDLPSAPVDGTPITVVLTPPRSISWLRITVNDSTTRLVGLSEVVVNGPPDVRMPDTPPPAPRNLTATQGAVQLAWSRLAEPLVSGYTIHYGTAAGHLTQTVNVGDVTSFMMRDRLLDGRTYHFVARAYNLVGTESLESSNEVTATVRAPVVLAIEPDQGPTAGDQLVTIRGENFNRLGARVTIGGHARAVVVVDETTITARTHYRGPGTVDVMVSNADDQTGVLPQAYTFVRPRTRLPAAYLPALSRGR